ncbi:hypothetical protein FRC09_003055 [Ceratobasidium sp. 395]|nr:hypothetical protein FRC09_003055 [Ceratobasidium sp. 395]
MANTFFQTSSNRNLYKRPLGEPMPAAPYLSINAPKSWDLGTTCCDVGEGETDRCESRARSFFELELELELGLDRCEAVLDEGRQGAAPELPYEDARAPNAAE